MADEPLQFKVDRKQGREKGSQKNMPLVALFQLSAIFQIFTVSQKGYQLGTKC